jgi:Flp pilus assembly protein TadG
MKMKATFVKFLRARRGMAAVEFALLAPMMVFFLFGSVDLLNLFDTNRRVQYTAVAVADVMARDTEVTDDEITGAWAAVDLLMAPDDGGIMRFRISSISVVNASTARVIWSEGQNWGARAANSTVTLPAGMMVPGTSVIMTETQWDYTTPFGILIDNRRNLSQGGGNRVISHTAYRRSRLVDPIPRG